MIMRTSIVTLLTIIVFSITHSASAAVIPCDTDNFTLATCQANCTGTWSTTNGTCTTGNPQPGSTPANPQPGSTPSVTLINPLNTGECAPNQNCLMNFLNKILEFVIRIGTVIVVLMIVYVGYLFVAAQGAPDKIKEARSALLWTVVGALILLGSQAIAIAIRATVQAISVGQ